MESNMEKEMHFDMDDAAQQVRERCKAALTERYGNQPNERIIERLIEEDREIEYAEAWQTLLLATDVADVCRVHGVPVFARGNLGASFFAYLLGVSECNPLPPHTVCPVCKTVEFVDPHKYPSGFDLVCCGAAQKTCPTCGAPLLCDGHGIPAASLFETYREPLTAELDVPEEALPLIRERTGKTLHTLPLSLRPNRALSVLWRMHDAVEEPYKAPIPDEQDVRLFIGEGINGSFGIGRDLFPKELEPTATPESFSELLTLYGLAYGTGTMVLNQERLSDPEHPFSGVIAFREDLQTRFLSHGMPYPAAYFLAEFIGKGKAKQHPDNEALLSLFEHGYTAKTVEALKTIGYLFPKAHAVNHLLLMLRLQRARETHPVEYYAAQLTVRMPKETDGVCFLTERKALAGAIDSCGDPCKRAYLEPVLEARDREIEFLPAVPGLSDPEAFLPGKGTIRLPLRLSGAIRRERPFFRPIAEFTSLRPDPEERQAPARAFAKDTLYPTLSEGLHLIGGRPGMGKTTLLLHLAAEHANSGVPVYYYTQEHLNVRCARRLMALLPEDLLNVPVYLADSVADADLWTLLRAARREIQTGVLILDGLELMVENRSPYPTANPYSEVHLREAAAATVLAEFAKQCRLPVLAAVPLSRDTEHRADHHPMLTDIRYHRRFVDEADTVVLLYRDGYYNDAGKGSPQPSEWIIAKNSFGPTATHRVCFDAEVGLYSDLQA